MGRRKSRGDGRCSARNFSAGCVALTRSCRRKAERLFDLITEFAGYGFNKSHSCAYALLAYQTAWLKTHYPVEFMAALLTSETGNTEKVVKYIRETRDMSITVLPPDVNSSDLFFTPVGEAIRFGLAAIKNVGENTVRGILRSARERLKGFQSFFQFCDAIDTRLLNRRVLESLIKSGAVDSLGARRAAQLFAVIDLRLGTRADLAAPAGFRRAAWALRLRAAASVIEAPEPQLPDAEEWPEHELLAAEFATLGFYISGHPLAKHAARLKELKAIDLSAVEGRRNGEDVTVAGIVVALRAMRSRKGDRWAILTLQDMTGVLGETLAFPGSLRSPGSPR